ncbi:MAG: enolase C-terminal domain-like protein [Gemmatimonadota bacterium]
MKIVAVEVHEVDVPDRPWAWSDEVFGMPAHRRDHVVILVVRTDAGLEGLGEVNLRFPRHLVDQEVSGWVGLDPVALNFAVTAAPGNPTVSERLRYAFECAILDLRGRALGCPVSELLGGRLRERVPVSLCTGYKTVENTAEDAAWGWEQGFRTYKMKCIVPEQTPELADRVTYIVDRVEAIHRRVPAMAVRPDIRRRLQEVWAAAAVARRLEGHCLDCLEDPITSGSRAGTFSEWRRLRQQVSVPIAEHTPPEQVLAMWRAEAVDFVIIGGLAHPTVRLSSTVDLLGLAAWTQSVGLGIANVLSLHVCAAGPGLSRPHDIVGLWAKEDDCVVEAFPVEDGTVAVPAGPGLGIRLDMDAVERYRVAS